MLLTANVDAMKNKGPAIAFALGLGAVVWLVAGLVWLMHKHSGCRRTVRGHEVWGCPTHSTGYLFWGFLIGVAWVALFWLVENRAWRARLVVKKDGRDFDIVARTWFCSDTLLSSHKASALDDNQFHEALSEARSKVALYNAAQRR